MAVAALLSLELKQAHDEAAACLMSDDDETHIVGPTRGQLPLLCLQAGRHGIAIIFSLTFIYFIYL